MNRHRTMVLRPWVMCSLLVIGFSGPGCGIGNDTKASRESSQTDTISASSTTEVELVRFEKEMQGGELYGYKDLTGRVVIEPSFFMGEEFSEFGLAAVADTIGWAYIDVSGQVVVRPFVIDNGPDRFAEGLARFERDGLFGFFDERGRVVIEASYDFAAPFSEGFAAICAGCRKAWKGEHWFMQGGKWGYIDRNGEIAIPLQYDEAHSFKQGRGRVVEAGETTIIGKDGRRIE